MTRVKRVGWELPRGSICFKGNQSDDFFCQKMSGPVEQMKSGMAPGSALTLVVSRVRNSKISFYTPNVTNDSFDLRFTALLDVFRLNKCDLLGALGPKEIHCRVTGFLISEISKT